MQISRTTIAIVASILALGCVLLVETDTDGAEIVASGMEKSAAYHAGKHRAHARFAKMYRKYDLKEDADKHQKLADKHLRLSKAKAATDAATDAQQKQLIRNLIDFKAYCDTNKDNIIEVSNGQGQTAVVLESLSKALIKAKIKSVGSAYAAWLKNMMKKYPLGASLAGNMAKRLDRKLRTKNGLITVSGEGQKAEASFTGKTMGLEGDPPKWHKLLHVPLVRVLGRARSYEIVHRKIKKGQPQFSAAEIKTLWGKKCVDNEAFGRSYSMGCTRYLKEHECHQHGGCMWQTGWEGK